MINLSTTAKAYIFGTILIGLGLLVWQLPSLEWDNPGLYLLAALGAAAQTLQEEGPINKTNYNIALYVYGFSIIALGPAAALFVVVVSHLMKWALHKYPWHIQSFNIGSYGVAVFLTG